VGHSESIKARSRARDLVVQSLYQMQIAGINEAELLSQVRERREFERVDQRYFLDAIRTIVAEKSSLEVDIDELADRPVSQLDPIERSILLLGFYELNSRQELPFKVVINESVNLAKRFGAVDGHKYINALLDRAVKKYRGDVGTGGK